MINLKHRLLESGLVLENAYLDKYVTIIFNNRSTNKEKFKTDAHHIIPAFYYRASNNRIDNSTSNIVNLYSKDHILAHIFLALCVTDKYKDAAAHSVGRVITGHEGHYENIEAAVDLLDFEELQKINEIRKHAISEASKLRKPNKNKIWINNGATNRMILPEDYDTYAKQGYTKGRTPLPEEGIEKMRQSRKGQKPSQATIDKRRAAWKKRYEAGEISVSVSTSTREQISNTLVEYYKINKHVSKGKIAINNKQLKKVKYVNEEDLPSWEAAGWEKGGSYCKKYRIFKDNRYKCVTEDTLQTWLNDGWELQGKS